MIPYLYQYTSYNINLTLLGNLIEQIPPSYSVWLYKRVIQDACFLTRTTNESHDTLGTSACPSKTQIPAVIFMLIYHLCSVYKPMLANKH